MVMTPNFIEAPFTIKLWWRDMFLSVSSILFTNKYLKSRQILKDLFFELRKQKKKKQKKKQKKKNQL